MSIEKRIEQISDKDIAEALLRSDSEENDTVFDQYRRIIEAYGFCWNKSTIEGDCEIFKDFIGRFARLVAMYDLAAIAEMQQRKKAAEMHLVMGIACDTAILFTSLGQTVEIPSERLISFAEKIVERVRNA